MKIAFYKGTTRPFNKLVSWWTRGPYSHCEVLFQDGWCASSSFTDGGVRFKYMELNPEHWDIIEVPNIDEEKVRRWFLVHAGEKYDVRGLAAVLTPIAENRRKWFCNEAIGAAIGISNPWRFSPNSFASVCEAMGGVWINKV